MALTIIFGLLGILLLIFMHELGHFIFAKIVGIRVEVFCVGIGPKIWKKQIGETEYAFSLIPLGGYCKMAGEILVGNQQPKPGDMYYGKVWRRALAVFGGPLFSLGGGWLFFILAVFFPRIESLTPSKIVIDQASVIQMEKDKNIHSDINFIDGDRILAIDGQDVEYYEKVFRIVTTSGGKKLKFRISRKEEIIEFEEVPVLLKDGLGFLPILPWEEAVLMHVDSGQPAMLAGLEKGDRILEINGNIISHAGEASFFIMKNSEEKHLVFKIERNGETKEFHISPRYNKDLQRFMIGVSFGSYRRVFVDGVWNPIEAVKKGSVIFSEIIGHNLRGIKNLFGRVNIFNVIAGPVRTTYHLGEVAKTTISQDDNGVKRISLYNILMMLAIFNISLGIMNLLPIPLLDGGMLMLYGIETVRGKYLPLYALNIYQYVGFTFIVLLIFLSFGSDFLHIFRNFFKFN